MALARAGGAGRAVNLRDAAFGALVAAFPNTGFMGMPLLTGLLGAAAAAPVMVTLLVDLILTTSICRRSRSCTAAPTWRRERGCARRAWAAAKRAALGEQRLAVARIILASTVLAFFSFSGLATWFGASSG